MPGKKKIKAKKTIPSPKRLNLPDNRPVKVNMSFEEGVKLAVNTHSPHKNMRLKDNNDSNLSSHPGFVEVLRASTDALPVVEKRNKKIIKRIIRVIKNGATYKYSKKGQTTTLFELLEALPNLNIQDLQSAIIDMECLIVSNSETVPIHFPAHYFK